MGLDQANTSFPGGLVRLGTCTRLRDTVAPVVPSSWYRYPSGAWKVRTVLPVLVVAAETLETIPSRLPQVSAGCQAKNRCHLMVPSASLTASRQPLLAPT